jgi:hypothetical protein
VCLLQAKASVCLVTADAKEHTFSGGGSRNGFLQIGRHTHELEGLFRASCSWKLPAIPVSADSYSLWDGRYIALLRLFEVRLGSAGRVYDIGSADCCRSCRLSAARAMPVQVLGAQPVMDVEPMGARKEAACSAALLRNFISFRHQCLSRSGMVLSS